MAPEQVPYGSSTAFASTNATCMFNGVRLLVRQVDIEYDEQEQIFESFVPTAWKLCQKRYDRINAKRKYLSDVARAERHFGFKSINNPTRRKR